MTEPERGIELLRNDRGECYVCGGGDSILKILKLLPVGIFVNKRVAYVTVAAEMMPNLNERILGSYSVLLRTFLSIGADSFSLVDSRTFPRITEADVWFFSGGQTAYLLQKMHDLRMREILGGLDHKPMILGISAGAIMMFEAGLSGANASQKWERGLGLLPGRVVIHSNDELKLMYPDHLHLDEYQWQRIILV